MMALYWARGSRTGDDDNKFALFLLWLGTVVRTGVTFGYPSQPKLFTGLEFGIDMKSRSKWKTFREFV